jgi:hypothetical protein
MLSVIALALKIREHLACLLVLPIAMEYTQNFL